MKKVAVLLTLFLLTLVSASATNFSREVYHQRIKYWLWKEDWPNAQIEAQKAIYDFPYDPWPAAWSAVALTRLGRDQEAPDVFLAAKRLGDGSPSLDQYLVEKGFLPWADSVRKRTGSSIRPLGIFTTALTLYPQSAALWQKSAEYLAGERRFTQALPFWIKLLESLPKGGIYGPAGEALRKGVREGLLQTWREDKATALTYVDMAFKYWPRDTVVAGPALFVKVKLSGEAEARKAIKALGWTGLDDYWELRILLASGRRWEAVDKLNALAEKNKTDYALLSGLGQTLEDELAGLNYNGRVADPLYYQALNFHAMAVTAWLATHDASVPFTLSPPMRGEFKVTQAAGGPSFHYGLNAHFSYDFSYTIGAPIYAVADGVVEEVTMRFPDRPLNAGPDVWANGNRITIRHANGIKSLYAHLKQESSKVQPGDTVKAGQEIAAQGNSGITLGSHLHYALVNADGYSLPSVFPGLEKSPDRSPGSWVPASPYLEGSTWYRTVDKPATEEAQTPVLTTGASE